MTKTSRTIVGMVAATALVVCGIFCLMRLRLPPPVTSAPSFVPSQAHAAWKQSVARIVAKIPSDAKADDFIVARDALAELRVRSEDRAAHLELVLALTARAADPQAQARVDRAVRAIADAP